MCACVSVCPMPNHIYTLLCIDTCQQGTQSVSLLQAGNEQQEQELYASTYVSGCLVPPCGYGGGGLAAPEVQYHLTQPVTPVEPHPLTLAALDKANDALSTSKMAADGEARNAQNVHKVGIQTSDVFDNVSDASVFCMCEHEGMGEEIVCEQKLSVPLRVLKPFTGIL
jgi:hypothetical protein